MFAISNAHTSAVTNTHADYFDLGGFGKDYSLNLDRFQQGIAPVVSINESAVNLSRGNYTTGAWPDINLAPYNQDYVAFGLNSQTVAALSSTMSQNITVQTRENYSFSTGMSVTAFGVPAATNITNTAVAVSKGQLVEVHDVHAPNTLHAVFTAEDDSSLVSPGSSGSPVIDNKGNLVGVISGVHNGVITLEDGSQKTASLVTITPLAIDQNGTISNPLK